MFRKVDEQRRVGGVRGDEEAAIRLAVTRGEQSKLGREDAVYGEGRNG